jgi:predicted ATPase
MSHDISTVLTIRSAITGDNGNKLKMQQQTEDIHSTTQDIIHLSGCKQIENQQPASTIPRRQSKSMLTRMVKTLQDQATGSKDTSSSFRNGRRFLKHSQIVGREAQLHLLDESYKRISTSQPSELVLVHGPSGAGKSTLVQAFVRKLPPNVLHIHGKFDQLPSHAPYAALVAASDQLCRQVLRRENSDEIRDRIRALLGPEVSLLGTLIPTLAKLTANNTDEQSSTAVSGQSFTQFKLLFRAFLRCVASPENPVIFFLDDLQWADAASLEVLKALLTDRLSHSMMIIGAYREGEMPIEILQKYNLAENCSIYDDSTSTPRNSSHRASITDIDVNGLHADSLNQLIATMLEMDESKTQSLSTLVWNKTDGNPFYALNFLDMLHFTRLLHKSKDGSWTWDEHQIVRKTNVADNLAAILETKVRNLPEQVRSILQIASFIGHDFPTGVLVTIVFEEQDMIATEYSFERHLREVIRDRIVDALKVALAEGLLETTPGSDEFKFAHDKIQQVLYEDLIPDDVERQLLHQRIGTLIWDSVKDKEPSEIDDWFVFLAADNLNRAMELVDYSGTRYDLIELNLTASKLATRKSAFLIAAEYLRIAVGLLDGDTSWNNRYDLCIDLYSTAAEAEKNIACYGRSSVLIKEIHKRATSLHDQSIAYGIEMNFLACKGDLKGSVLLGLDVLRKIGVKFPRKINFLVVVKEFIRAKAALGTRPLQDLLHLPEMTDQKMLVALKLMNAVAVNAFTLGNSFKETFAAICLRMFRLTLKYGLSALYSSTVFALWGSVHAVLGQFDTSIKAEQLSFDVVDKFNAESIRGSTVIINYIFNHLWRNKLDYGARDEFLHAYHLAMSFGDISRAHQGFNGWVFCGIFLDEPLMEIHARTRSVVAEMREYDSKTSLMLLLPNWQVVSGLTMSACCCPIISC